MSKDPRDLFINLNPLGLDESELVKDSTGFADMRTHADYQVFLAGYKAGAADGENHESESHHQLNAEGCNPDSIISPVTAPADTPALHEKVEPSQETRFRVCLHQHSTNGIQVNGGVAA